MLTGCGDSQSAFAGLNNETDSLSYAIGMDLGKNFSTQGIEISASALKQGIEDQVGGTAQLNDQQIQTIMQAFQMKMQQKQMDAMAEKAAGAKQEGAAFLAENGKKEGVMTTPSGLQYKIEKPGTGKQPTIDNQVKCHYAGTLLDGTEFDSSYKRGEPAVFPLRNVIQAWQEAVPMLKEGGKMEIWAPSDIAYGDMGSPPAIGPGATLHFVIELIEVMPN